MYELQITFVKVDSKGNDRNVKENLILEHAEKFFVPNESDELYM